MRLLRRILKRKKSTSIKKEDIHELATSLDGVFELAGTEGRSLDGKINGLATTAVHDSDGTVSELAGTTVRDFDGAVNEIGGRMVDELDGIMINNPASMMVEPANPSQAERTDFDEVASIESGDQIVWEKDDTISDDTVSSSTCLIYEKLELAVGEFRILFLQPARDKADDIHCLLMKDHLGPKSGNKPIYEALSYTWGEAKEMHIIFVNERPFPVIPNLFVALKYLRKTEESRILWIDAICIDQNSLLEKTHQVGMMRDIYRGASQVLIWLGESDRDIRRAMAFLRQRKRFQLLTSDELNPFVPGLAKIFNQPWWSRIWVVQEVLVATKPPLLGCGRRWLSWEDVETGMANLKRHQITGEVAESSFENPMAFNDLGLMTLENSNDGHHRRGSRNPWAMRRKWWSLEDLLTATCNRNTTQPHDKVFSLLGLTLDSVLAEVPIDYDQPYNATYQKAMSHVLRSNMGFLVHAMHLRKADGVPSWCVDFLTPDWPNYVRACGWHHSSKGRIGVSGWKPKLKVLHDPVRGTIEVLGTIIGCINHVNTSKCGPPNLTDSEKTRYSENYRADHPDAEQRKFLHRQHDYLINDVRTFGQVVKRALSKRYSQDEVLQMLSSGIVWKIMGHGIEPKLYDEDFAYLQTNVLNYHYVEIENIAQIQFAKYGTFANRRLELIAAISLNLIDKSLLTTDTGYVGQAPIAVGTVVEGDLLCIIHGFHVPVILRQQRGTGAYRVVTFTWVSNLIEKQLFKGFGPESQRLTLC
ncbi:MAG: hypothetical protein Q9214_000809 [Letrouitia sp. 1 TL-2023]